MVASDNPVLSWDDWLALADEPPDWLVPGLLERGAAGLVHGATQSYKSFLMLRLCLDLAAGKRVLDLFPAVAPQTTLLYQAEGSRAAWRRRLVRLKEDYPPGIPFWSRHVLTEKLDSNKSNINEVLALVRPALFVIDPIANFFGGADTDAVSIQRWRDVSNAWRAAYDCAVIWVQHDRQPLRFFGGGKILKLDAGIEEARGKTELVAWADLILGLKRTGDVTMVAVQKVRDDPTGQQYDFKLDGGKLVLVNRPAALEQAVMGALGGGEAWLAAVVASVATSTATPERTVRRCVARMVAAGTLTQTKYGGRPKLARIGGADNG